MHIFPNPKAPINNPKELVYTNKIALDNHKSKIQRSNNQRTKSIDIIRNEQGIVIVL